MQIRKHNYLIFCQKLKSHDRPYIIYVLHITCDIFLESPGYKEPYGNAMGQIPMSNQNHLIFLEQGVGESKAVGVERGIYCD